MTTPVEKNKAIVVLERQMRAILDASADGIITFDTLGFVVGSNLSAQRLFEYSPVELLGLGFSALFETTDSFDRINAGQLDEAIRLTAVRADGKRFPVDVRYRKFESSGESHLVASIHDVSAEEESRTQLTQMERLDSLTRLSNRSFFQETIESYLQNIDERQQQLGIVMIDLNRFKRINESMGHSAGDEILRTVAQRLENGAAQAVKASEGKLTIKVARLGGDEFAVVVLRVGQDDALLPVHVSTAVDHLLAELAGTTFDAGDTPLWITGSAGIALHPRNGRDYSTLLKKADAALHHAKSSSSEVDFYRDDMQLTPSFYLKTEVDLYAALLEQQFVPYFQPRVNLEDGRLVGAEALVRWQHPNKGLLSPGDFLPVAKTAGLISRIDLQMLELTCRQIAYWRHTGPPDIVFSINVSEQLLKSGRLLSEIERALGAHGLEASCLEVEINEEVLMEDVASAIEELQAVREHGVKVSIDDFGTGRTALRWLHDLPVDIMKIDQSFIRDLANHPETQAVVKSVIQLGQGLGLEVVAEGIESSEDEAVLKALHCVTGQGYYYAKPMPATEFAGRFMKRA
jgi:diguanylate cyclase (GGDEF)-like protein/PAS domain S-box-containing protein